MCARCRELTQPDRPFAVAQPGFGVAEREGQRRKSAGNRRTADERERPEASVRLIVASERIVDDSAAIHRPRSNHHVRERNPGKSRCHHARRAKRGERLGRPRYFSAACGHNRRNPVGKDFTVGKDVESVQGRSLCGAELARAPSHPIQEEAVHLQAALRIRIVRCGHQHPRILERCLTLVEAPLWHGAHRAKQRCLPAIARVTELIGQLCALQYGCIRAREITGLEMVARQPGECA